MINNVSDHVSPGLERSGPVVRTGGFRVTSRFAPPIGAGPRAIPSRLQLLAPREASAGGTTAHAQPSYGGLEHSWGQGASHLLCRLVHERWPFFGVEEFPDLEAVQRHEQILTDLNWARYIDSRTTLGTELILPQ